MKSHFDTLPADKKCQLQDIQRVGKELLMTMRADPNDTSLVQWALLTENCINNVLFLNGMDEIKS